MKDFLIEKFGWAVLVSHFLGIIFITKYDALCHRPYSFGIHATIGIIYCVVMMAWSVYHIAFWKE